MHTMSSSSLFEAYYNETSETITIRLFDERDMPVHAGSLRRVEARSSLTSSPPVLPPARRLVIACMGATVLTDDVPDYNFATRLVERVCAASRHTLQTLVMRQRFLSGKFVEALFDALVRERFTALETIDLHRSSAFNDGNFFKDAVATSFENLLLEPSMRVAHVTTAQRFFEGGAFPAWFYRRLVAACRRARSVALSCNSAAEGDAVTRGVAALVARGAASPLRDVKLYYVSEEAWPTLAAATQIGAALDDSTLRSLVSSGVHAARGDTMPLASEIFGALQRGARCSSLTVLRLDSKLDDACAVALCDALERNAALPLVSLHVGSRGTPTSVIRHLILRGMRFAHATAPLRDLSLTCNTFDHTLVDALALALNDTSLPLATLRLEANNIVTPGDANTFVFEGSIFRDVTTLAREIEFVRPLVAAIDAAAEAHRAYRRHVSVVARRRIDFFRRSAFATLETLLIDANSERAETLTATLASALASLRAVAWSDLY